MNFSETDSYTIISRSYHNESLSHNSKLSTEHKTLSFFNETAAKKDTEKVYCELISLLSIRDWWVRYVTMWDITLQQLFNEVSMLRSYIDKD